MPFPGGGGAHLGTAYADVELRLTKLEDGFRKANAGFEKFGKDANARLKSVGESAQALGRSLTLSVTTPLVALGTAAVRSAVQMDSLKRGLTAVAGSSREAERQLVRLREIAKLPGLGFKEAIQGSIRLQAAGLSARTAERALRGFGNAIATVGGGKAQLDGVTLALSQMASKGKVFAEEINQINERVPQIRKIMEEAFGTSNTELLQKAGITAQQFIEAITLGLEKQTQATSGAQNAMENFQMAADEALTKIGETLLPSVTRALEAGTRKLEDFAGWWSNLSQSSRDAIVGGGGIVASLGLVTYAVGTVITAISSAIESFGKLRAAASLAAVSTLGKVGAIAAAGFVGGKALTEMAQSPGNKIYNYDPARGMVPTSPGAIPLFQVGSPRPGKPRPVGVTREQLAKRFEKSIGDINRELGTAITEERRQALLRDRAALTRDALSLRLSVPGAAQRESAGLTPPNWLKALQDKVAQTESELGAKKNKRGQKAKKAAGAPEYEEGDFLFGVGGVLRGTMGEWAQNAELMAGTAEWMSSMEEMSRSLRDSLTPITADPLESMFGGMNIDTIDGMSQGFDELRLSFEGLAKAAEEGRGKIYESFAKGMFGNLGGMKNALGLGNLSSPERMGDQMKRLQQTWKRGFDWMGSFARNLADEFYYSFAEGVERMFGRNPFGRAIARVLSKWFDQIIENAMTTLVNPESTGGQKKSAWGSLLGAGLGSMAGPIGGIVGGLFGGLFAEGGRAPGRRWSVVGERGPELVYPATDSQVVPFSRFAGAGAGIGGGVTVNMGGVVIRETADADRVMDRIAARLQTLQRVR